MACILKYNILFGSVHRIITIPGDCRLFVRPPWHEAFKAYEKFVLHEESEPHRVAACLHVSIKEEAYIKLTMKNMKEPAAQARELDEAEGMYVEVKIQERIERKWVYASMKPLQKRCMLHGTDLEAFAEIFKHRRLKAAASSPKGVCAVLAPADGEEFPIPPCIS